MQILAKAPRSQEVIDFKALQEVYQYFSKKDLPFISYLTERMYDEQPYRDIQILHNTHLTLATLCKLEPLLASGAELKVTVSKNLKCDPRALELLQRAKIPFLENDELDDSFDFVLDCCAGMLDIIKPRYGAIELTQTGSVKYKQAETSYPVISVDESLTKNLENFLGTGEGFIRAFLEMTHKDIRDKKFILFGYGKVGKGLVQALLPYTQKIVVIEQDISALSQATVKGLRALHISEKQQVCLEVQDAFCIITATGVNGVISNDFERSDFIGPYLANIGSEDEFGAKFLARDVLFNKDPINFYLSEPTRIKYLDPVFYAHNQAIDFILSGQINKGFHPFPPEHDLAIFNHWMGYHHQNVAREIQSL